MLPVIAGVEGVLLTERERELFSRLQPAGYILFSRNISDYEMTRELTDDLRSLTQGPDLPIIAIDQEGGRVVRTAGIDVCLPSASALAATQSEHTITQAAYYNAQCLYTLGVNTDFAPVLDLGSGRANALPGRCWGSDTQEVISNAGVWNRAILRRGIMTSGKHFPGMGAAESDPHYTLPVLRGTRESFLEEASIPFTALMPELPSLMVAHLMLPDIDDTLPSSLSPALVQGFLRNQLGYDGVVFTDDLCMGAIANSYSPEQSVSLALQAGCDLPLVCHKTVEYLERIAAEVETLPKALLYDVERRITRFRIMLSTFAPMRFIEWRDYLKDVAAFTASVPEVDPSAPASPVLDY